MSFSFVEDGDWTISNFCPAETEVKNKENYQLGYIVNVSMNNMQIRKITVWSYLI